MNIPVILAGFLLAAQQSSGTPEAKEISGIRVEVDTTWATPKQGYPYPIRIRMFNRGPARDVVVKCRMPVISAPRSSLRFHDQHWEFQYQPPLYRE